MPVPITGAHRGESPALHAVGASQRRSVARQGALRRVPGSEQTELAGMPSGGSGSVMHDVPSAQRLVNCRGSHAPRLGTVGTRLQGVPIAPKATWRTVSVKAPLEVVSMAALPSTTRKSTCPSITLLR